MPYGYAIPGIWVYAADQFQSGLVYPAFLTRDQQARLERIRQARLLFDGRHRQYFFDEERTQFDFPPAVAGYRVNNPYISYNALRLISLKGADLLLGAPPVLRVQDPAQQKFLEAYLERSAIRSLLYSSAVSCSYEADALIETCIHDGEVYSQAMDGSEVFPIGPMLPGGQFREYMRCRVKKIGDGEAQINLMLEEHYLPGSITRALWQLTKEGQKMRTINLDAWPLDDGETPPVPETKTGIPLNTITWIPNDVLRGKSVSDYDIALDLQDALNAKQTQLAMCIAKHLDPMVKLPGRMADDQGNLRAANKAIFSDDPMETFGYITWNAQIAGAMGDRDFALHNLFVSTETAPVLMGLAPNARAEAFKTVKIGAMPSLKKAERKGVYWQIGIKRMITVAQSLEQTLPGIRYEIGPIGVSLRDGIPTDELDQANQLAMLKGAGLLSEKRGVEILVEDPAAAAEELAELQKENDARSAAATPQILLGKHERGDGPGGEVTTEEEEAASSAASADELEEVAA